jgi:manganese/zinc/iron transport system permease protein
MDWLASPFRLFLEDPESYLWIGTMGFLVAASCGLVGAFLVIRKSALLGDAISHSVLPGIVIAFLITGSRATWGMMIGAIVAGILTTLAIDLVCRKTRIKEDAAIGIVFSFFFAVGVILMSQYASKVDLDLDCVLYGEIGFIALEPFVEVGGFSLAPEPIVRTALILIGIAALIRLFFKELVVCSFDATYANTIGVGAQRAHYLLVVVLSITVVSAFESVGAVLVVAMLILPGSTAYLFCDRLPRLLASIFPISLLTSGLGVYGSLLFDCSPAGAMVVSSFLLFVLAWFLSPEHGLVAQWRRRTGSVPVAA